MKLREMLVKPSTSIVDVRTNPEYVQEHLPNAINIPLDEVSMRIHEFKNMSKPIVVYCRSGNRSETVKNILKLNGINDVINGGSIYDLKQST
jgi:phage shock protein E